MDDLLGQSGRQRLTSNQLAWRLSRGPRSETRPGAARRWNFAKFRDEAPTAQDKDARGSNCHVYFVDDGNCQSLEVKLCGTRLFDGRISDHIRKFSANIKPFLYFFFRRILPWKTGILERSMSFRRATHPCFSKALQDFPHMPRSHLFAHDHLWAQPILPGGKGPADRVG